MTRLIKAPSQSTVKQFRKPKYTEKIIAVDTETTGLYIHKGCAPFIVTATSYYTKKNHLWRFHVDPFTRQVRINKQYIKEIRDLIFSHEELVFHNANFDLQALNALGITWDELYELDVHDSMVMSHAYNSQNKHGLKDLAILLLNYPDDDEKFLSEATKKAIFQAKKLGWKVANKHNLPEELLGLKKEVYRSDYWVVQQIAEELKYPSNHPWHSICKTYATRDTERTVGIYLVLRELLLNEQHLSKYDYEEIEYTGTLYDKYQESRRLIRPILDMQYQGIPVKPRALAESKKLYETRLSESLEQLRSLSGIADFNPRSPIQLRKVLFDIFKYKPVKVSKSGPSCDKDVLSKLMLVDQVEHGKAIPKRLKFLIALKEFRKEGTTLQYLTNYDNHSRFSKDRIIIPTFSQTRTGTGRLSCVEPNTTNVGKKDMSNPFADDKNRDRASLLSELLGIDDDHRFSLRNVFGPKRGQIWTCIDYDQFQLRIFAVVSESYDLIEAFDKGLDVHMTVARKIFNKDDISDVERTAAKAINFGVLFGAGPAKIELLAGVPGLYKLFTDNFPNAKKYLDKQSFLARTKGYVHTVGGYRLYVPRETPHAASCYGIQGTEAEIVRNAMVRIHNERHGNPYQLLMMVHDELVFTSTEHSDEHLSRIMHVMEESGKDLGIPCKVDAKVTTTDWATRKSYDFERIYHA